MEKGLQAKFIAKRIAGELKFGDFVNLGVGLPTAVSDYVESDRGILFQGENGVIGLGKAAFNVIDSFSAKSGAPADETLVINAGCTKTSINPGASFFDSATSFGLIRGGHVDVTVLGTLQVDQEGNIANYIIPGKMIAGMGGAMDLCVGCPKVIVATYHTSKGNPKIIEKCTLPLTAPKAVNTIVSEMGVFDITPEGIKMREYNPEYTIKEIKAATGCKLIVPDDVPTTPEEYFENL